MEQSNHTPLKTQCWLKILHHRPACQITALKAQPQVISAVIKLQNKLLALPMFLQAQPGMSSKATWLCWFSSFVILHILPACSRVPIMFANLHHRFNNMSVTNVETLIILFGQQGGSHDTQAQNNLIPCQDLRPTTKQQQRASLVQFQD